LNTRAGFRGRSNPDACIAENQQALGLRRQHVAGKIDSTDLPVRAVQVAVSHSTREAEHYVGIPAPTTNSRNASARPMVTNVFHRQPRRKSSRPSAKMVFPRSGSPAIRRQGRTAEVPAQAQSIRTRLPDNGLRAPRISDAGYSPAAVRAVLTVGRERIVVRIVVNRRKERHYRICVPVHNA